jgi:hypothetical protein
MWGPSDFAGGTALIIRRLIVPLAAAAFVIQGVQAQAQGAFPAPLPGAAAPSSSPFPPVNGGGAPSAFPSNGAAPVGGGGFGGAPPGQQAGPPGGEACMKEFVPLRQDAEKRGAAIKAASDRHAPPEEACKLIGNFSQAEIKMIKYVEVNSAKCGIPPQIAEQLKNGHKNTDLMLKKVCSVAQQQQQRGPSGPSLSDVLGSSTAVPEASAKRSGGSTFDTLNGNVLAR